jgi:hypothetical protein
MNISLFKSVKDTSSPFNKPVQVALDRIKNGASKELNLKIRESNDKEIQKTLKSKLPGVCFNGTFTNRSIKGLDKKSGLIILDFDGFENKESALQYKESLKEDAYIFATWISPSNIGVKVLVKIPTEGEHKGYFDALRLHFNSEHWDVSSSNIDRFCFESYDSDLFQNNNSMLWSVCELPESDEIGTSKPFISIKSDNRIIENLMKWWNKKYGFVQGQKNNNLFKLAAAFNTFGINKSECEHVLNQFCNGKNDKEIQQLINSAYKNVADFRTRFFEDKDVKQRIEKQVKAGSTLKDIANSFPGVDKIEIEASINEIKENNVSDDFWTYDRNGRCILSAHQYKFWLQSKNFSKYFPTDSNTYTFIRKEKGLVEETNDKRIKDFVLSELLKRNDIGFLPYDMMANTTKYFSNDFLACLESTEMAIKEDTSDTCYIYYQNCTVEIKKDSINTIGYENIEGYVWKKQVINRIYEQSDHHESEFRKFLWLISGKNIQQYNSFKSVIGYLLHSFKTSANNKAIIFNDETISDNPNGGSGKGLFWNALTKMKKVASIDGKTFEFTKSFPYQTVSTDTQILIFDDVKKNFSFESLFSLITEGITLEYKGQDAIKLPINKSPKILITTNYTIGGIGGSFERRKFEVEMSSYFSNKYTPVDEFGHLLFDDWNEAEWSRFDNYMIQCCQFYLINGLIKNDFKNLEIRKFIKETSFEFYEWANTETLPFDIRLPKNELFDILTNDYSDLKKWLQKKTLNRWIKTYCEFHKYEYKEGKSNNNLWLEINKPKGSFENPIKIDI